jgi:hypothetical protein
MSMAATKDTPLDRLQTFREWLKFTRNGLIVSFLVGLVLFWNSSHSADEISVAIAIPLIIFNCIPFVLHSLSALLPEPPQKPLPLKIEPVDFKNLPRHRRIRALMSAGIVIFMIICLFGGCAIFIASFTYPYFGVPWAVMPARYLSYVMFGFTALPVVAVLSFIAGMAYTGKVRDSATALWIYLRAIRPLTHWPTYA